MHLTGRSSSLVLEANVEAVDEDGAREVVPVFGHGRAITVSFETIKDFVGKIVGEFRNLLGCHLTGSFPSGRLRPAS